jgi:RNA recognition motif-containing protein
MAFFSRALFSEEGADSISVMKAIEVLLLAKSVPKVACIDLIRRARMGAKLYVGNLAYAVTDDRLEQHFAQQGSVVSARVITDKFSGRSKGFGFVEMASDAEAAKALNALNGTEFEGRNIVVSEARPQTPRSSGADGYPVSGARPPRRDRDRS